MAFFNGDGPSVMNGSVSDNNDSQISNDSMDVDDKTEEDTEEEDESVSAKCEELVNLAKIVDTSKYQPALPHSVTQTYLKKVGFSLGLVWFVLCPQFFPQCTTSTLLVSYQPTGLDSIKTHQIHYLLCSFSFYYEH